MTRYLDDSAYVPTDLEKSKWRNVLFTRIQRVISMEKEPRKDSYPTSADTVCFHHAKEYAVELQKDPELPIAASPVLCKMIQKLEEIEKTHAAGFEKHRGELNMTKFGI